MRMNPVLRNESKLAVRTPRFTILLFIYIAILTAGVLVFYNSYINMVNSNGLDLQASIVLYFGMAIGQAILLMFIVPALTATAICSEREKQTLDMLLSSKLTPLQIIIGKVSSSSAKVIMLIICTMPMYAICGLVGGVKLSNIIGLIGFFIVTTIFVGSMGVFVSTYVKTSKVSTAVTYGLVLFIFGGTLIISWIIMFVSMMNTQVSTVPQISWIAYLSPITGFITMLGNQVGMMQDFNYMTSSFGISEYAQYISIAVQLGLSAMFIWLSAIKLNPLNTRNKFKVKKSKKI